MVVTEGEIEGKSLPGRRRTAWIGYELVSVKVPAKMISNGLNLYNPSLCC